MLGVLLKETEVYELEYLLKKELEIIINELKELKHNGILKEAIEERYKIIFDLYARIVPPKEFAKYIIKTKKNGR